MHAAVPTGIPCAGRNRAYGRDHGPREGAPVRAGGPLPDSFATDCPPVR
jgi:hypothetical protein